MERPAKGSIWIVFHDHGSHGVSVSGPTCVFQSGTKLPSEVLVSEEVHYLCNSDICSNVSNCLGSEECKQIDMISRGIGVLPSFSGALQCFKFSPMVSIGTG